MPKLSDIKIDSKRFHGKGLRPWSIKSNENGEQSVSKQLANGEQSVSKQLANGEQSVSKQLANGEQSVSKW